MSNVVVKENETLDSALRRFKRSCAKAGIMQEVRKREHYEKPSVKRKKKSEAARKRKYNSAGNGCKAACVRQLTDACFIFADRLNREEYILNNFWKRYSTS